MDTPSPPDPMQTAKAQADMNKETAVAQTGLNSTNQYTPDGSLVYNEAGKWSDGTPHFSATTSLNPANKAIYDTNLGTKQNIATIGKDQSARIGDLLGTPLKLGNDATEARAMELGMSRLTPQFARDDEALRTKLANSGIRAGSDAFAAEMGTLGQNKNDAITQLLLKGRGLADQEITAERNQPINEVSALLSGSQVSNPNFVSTPQTSVGGVNYSGLVQDQYKNQTAQGNAAMGGMFGLAGTALQMAPFMMSDRRLKDDIIEVGTLKNGLPVYLFRYKVGGPMQLGLMADDVEKVKPEAVKAIGPHGYKAVDYAQAVEA